MNWRLGMTISVALLAVGCGHGDGESNERAELSGVFQAGDVSGVHYRTQTREGVTDASGTFKYLAGETVTFSIGGIELGAVPGSAAITPFTLAGMTPPTTEPALRRELNRASRTTSNFVRAINMQRLLLALDADNNPANGLDVRGRETTLASAALDFDQTIPQFVEKLDKLAPDLTHNMPRWLPVVLLYRALGIAVPAHAPVQYDSDDGYFAPRQSVISYHPDGSLESRNSNDGFGGSMYNRSYTYDSLGRTTVSHVASQSFWQSGYTEEQRWSYDSRGTITGSISERDEGADGAIDFGMSVDYEFDAFNNLLRQVTRQDIGHDGVVDRVEDYRASYDARLNREGAVSETDANVDGTIDTRYNYVADYDSRNRLISQRAEWDEPADGVVDSLETWSIACDAGGPGAVEIYERDADADGVLEHRLTNSWNYDGSGTLRTLDILQESDIDAVGELNSQTHAVISFDRDARILSEVQTEDRDGNAGFESVSRRVLTYTDYGSPLRELSEWDFDGDGEVDIRYTTDYQYGAGGEVLSTQTVSEYGAGSTPTPSSSTQVTNLPMTDGVLMLAQQYFEFAFLTGAVAIF